MKQLIHVKRAIQLLLAVALLATWAPAQTTSGGTIVYSKQVLTNATGTGASAIVRNVNQGSHWLFYCSSGNTNSITIQLEQSPDGVSNWHAVSPVGNVAGGCGIIQAGGYWPAIRANVVAYNSTGAGTINAWYSASTGVISEPQNVGTQTTSGITTQVPIVSGPPITNLLSTPQQVGAVGVVLYGASIYNPNASVVYVSFNSNNTAAPNAGFAVFAIPGTTSMVVQLPASGVYNFGATATYVQCSTSLTAQADPGSACLVQAFYKVPAVVNGVPN